MEKHYKSNPNMVVEPAYYSNGIPVFEPTMKQFEDFYKFNKAINKYGMESGIVKVIPPPEWTLLLAGTYTRKNLESVKIKNPIVQNMNITPGYQGVYTLQNIERQRTYNIFQWKELSQKPNYMPPSARKSRGRASQLPPAGESKQEDGENTKQSTGKVSPPFLDGDFNIDISEFTAERCELLEQMYWKSLGYAEPMYGADMLGSLFLARTKSWNVSQLDNILDMMEEKLPGVNDAYLYAGLWKSTFSWHLEDQDLYSINYLHFGAPKQWYSIPQRQNGKFYDLMKEIFGEDYKNCPEFLRHKTFLASPLFLAKNGIQCNSVVHNQGEFMITYPYGYHAGFNYGYNLAESVNFALDDWFEYAEKTQKCECISDSVGINFRQIYCKFKGIEYVPQASEVTVYEDASDESIRSQSPTSKLVIKSGNRKKRRVETFDQECLLCPNNLSPLLKVYSKFELLDTDVVDQKTHSALQVHRICASMFPNQLRITIGASTDKVEGMNDISKAQRNLKCQVCHVGNRILQSVRLASNGACFQCTQSKCTRAYHGTCALAAGFDYGSECCRIHRLPKSPFYEIDDKQFFERLENIVKDSAIQFTLTRGIAKRHSGDIHCGIVQANNVMENSFQVLVYPNLTDLVEIQYNDVILGTSKIYDNQQFMAMTKVQPQEAKSLQPMPAFMSSNHNLPPLRTFKSDPQLKTAAPTIAYSPPSFNFNNGNYRFDMRPTRPGPPSGLVYITEFPGQPMGQASQPHRFVGEPLHEL